MRGGKSGFWREQNCPTGPSLRRRGTGRVVRDEKSPLVWFSDRLRQAPDGPVSLLRGCRWLLVLNKTRSLSSKIFHATHKSIPSSGSLSHSNQPRTWLAFGVGWRVNPTPNWATGPAIVTLADALASPCGRSIADRVCPRNGRSISIGTQPTRYRRADRDHSGSALVPRFRGLTIDLPRSFQSFPHPQKSEKNFFRVAAEVFALLRIFCGGV